MAKKLKIISWNVNGIRAALRREFMSVLDHKPDILCIQETKAHPEQVELELPGYEMFWHSAEKKGYSGTAVFTKLKPKSVKNGLAKLDNEGRVITAEFDDFYLVNCYTPNSKRGLLRLDYRKDTWDPAFLRHLKRLEKKKPVVFCGDFNVAHEEIDLANPKSNRRNAGFTDEERSGFSNYMKAGFLDTFREFESGGGHYTWWTMRTNARERNIGWRIDYFCMSPKLRPNLKAAKIYDDVFGSDHCPVGINLQF